MATLTSGLFAGDPKLEACAASDPAHVVPGARGDHVRKIQDALDQIDKAGLAGTPEYKASLYGEKTAAAVTRFKTVRNILNYAGRIDPIVGKKTIKALDSAVAAASGKGGGLEAATDPSRYLDIVVRFVGGGNVDGEDWAKAGINLARYAAPGARRRFLGIGKGAAVGRPSGVDAALQEIVSALRPDESRGLLFLYGSSLGGRQAIELARKLVDRQIAVTYLGLSDAAFFGSEAINAPDADPVWGEPRNHPEFMLGSDLPGTMAKESYFQKWGNHASRINRTGRVLWTSDMNGEVHGCPLRFTPQNVSDAVELWRRNDDDMAHVGAVGVADRRIQGVISATLSSA